jgi:hypothetical protein
VDCITRGAGEEHFHWFIIHFDLIHLPISLQNVVLLFAFPLRHLPLLCVPLNVYSLTPFLGLHLRLLLLGLCHQHLLYDVGVHVLVIVQLHLVLLFLHLFACTLRPLFRLFFRLLVLLHKMRLHLLVLVIIFIPIVLLFLLLHLLLLLLHH